MTKYVGNISLCNSKRLLRNDPTASGAALNYLGYSITLEKWKNIRGYFYSAPGR